MFSLFAYYFSSALIGLSPIQFADSSSSNNEGPKSSGGDVESELLLQRNNDVVIKDSRDIQRSPRALHIAYVATALCDFTGYIIRTIGFIDSNCVHVQTLLLWKWFVSGRLQFSCYLECSLFFCLFETTDQFITVGGNHSCDIWVGPITTVNKCIQQFSSYWYSPNSFGCSVLCSQLHSQ